MLLSSYRCFAEPVILNIYNHSFAGIAGTNIATPVTIWVFNRNHESNFYCAQTYLSNQERFTVTIDVEASSIYSFQLGDDFPEDFSVGDLNTEFPQISIRDEIPQKLELEIKTTYPIGKLDFSPVYTHTSHIH